MLQRLLKLSICACVLASLAFVSQTARAGDALTLTYEYSTSVNGPWSPVDPASIHVSPNGATTVETPAGASAFFRMRVASNGQETSIPVLTLAQIPPATITAMRNHISRLVGAGGAAALSWADVEIAPFAAPLSNPNSELPSHYELRVLRKPQAVREAGFRKFESSEIGDTARGYMICSANENDLPISEFATEGSSPVEGLLRKCGGVAPARIIRFGAGFWVAENARGELLANHGTEPFRLPAGFSDLTRQGFSGVVDTETGQNDHPPAQAMRPSFYRDYREFKSDYETNGVYKLLRERRAGHAKAFWDAERGIYPQVLKVVLRETEIFLASMLIDNVITEVELGERAVASVIALRTGGLRVEGLLPGRMGIKVRVGETVTRYLVEVTLTRQGDLASGKKSSPAGAVPLPFWKTITEVYAGKWGDQMHWKQLKDPDWCQAVGCGPTALAMMFGWWEHKKNVPSAFYHDVLSFQSISSVDAPPWIEDFGDAVILKGAYSSLHELCDVICDPGSDAGATMPEDLIEAFFGYLQPVASPFGSASIKFGKGQPLVGYSCSWAYDFWSDDWDSSGVRVANGLKNGRPGVVGLGFLWHYARLRLLATGLYRDDQWR